jgi:spore coat protein CotH
MTTRRATQALLVSIALLVPDTGAAQGSDVFAADSLHDVHLRMNSRDLEELRISYTLNTYYPADIQWGSTIARNVAVRSRGNGSRNANKLGLRVDVDHFVTGQRFAGLDALVLDNLIQDATLLREHAAMALFTRMGQVAPRTSFARLFINSEYQGLYALVEEPNEAFVERHFGPDKGYLFEYHWLDPYYFDDLGDDLEPYAQRFEARTRERSAPSSLYNPLRELARIEEGESLEGWRARVSEFVDLSQLITMAAIEQFLSESDGLIGADGLNNVYVYRSSSSTRHIFVPWDRDNAFNNVDSPIDLRTAENRLVRQALAFPDLRALYLERLTEAALLSDADGWLLHVIEQANAVIGEAALADHRKHFGDDARAAAVDALVDFARRRPAIVLDQIRQARGASLVP